MLNIKPTNRNFGILIGILISLVFFAIVVFPHSSKKELSNSNKAAPKITWLSDKITVTLSPGQSLNKQITFISNETLPDISIQASADIKTMLNVQVGNLLPVTANKPQFINLSFSIPGNTILGTYEGVIYIRSRGKIIAQTLNVKIDVWQNFTDSTLGLSLKYPPSFTVAPSDPVSNLGVYIHEINEEYPGEGITVFKTSKLLTDILSELNSEMTLINRTMQTFNGTNWIIVTHKEIETDVEFVTALTEKNNGVIMIGAKNNSNILPTFSTILQNISF